MSVLTRPCGRLPGQELYIKKKESANRPISRPGSQQPYKTYRRPTLIQRVPQMFCIALRSMSRLRFGLDLSTSAGPSHGFGCKVTTYFRYGQRKGKVFSCKYHHRRQKRRWRKVPSRRDGMRSRRDGMKSRRDVMASRRAVSFRNEKKLFLILANFFPKTKRKYE